MSGETELRPSGWTVDTLREFFQRQLDDMQRMLDERYATQVKAVDAAFLAQQTAMQTALTAAERAVQTALLSAEKAVVKAETANEKRFEAANEWRQQSADRERSQQEQTSMLTATFMPREVGDAQLASLRAEITSLSSRVDRAEGGVIGTRRARDDVRLSFGALFGAATAIVAIIGLIVVLAS